MEALSAAGVPVYAERGRHGGFALLPDFRTALTGLTHDEALALLVAGSRRGAQLFGLGSALASAVLKVVDALPDGLRETAAGAAQRLLVDPETDLLARPVAPEEVPDAVATQVRRAVFGGHRLRIHYAAVNQPRSGAPWTRSASSPSRTRAICWPGGVRRTVRTGCPGCWRPSSSTNRPCARTPWTWSAPGGSARCGSVRAVTPRRCWCGRIRRVGTAWPPRLWR